MSAVVLLLQFPALPVVKYLCEDLLVMHYVIQPAASVPAWIVLSIRFEFMFPILGGRMDGYARLPVVERDYLINVLSWLCVISIVFLHAYCFTRIVLPWCTFPLRVR